MGFIRSLDAKHTLKAVWLLTDTLRKRLRASLPVNCQHSPLYCYRATEKKLWKTTNYFRIPLEWLDSHFLGMARLTKYYMQEQNERTKMAHRKQIRWNIQDFLS